MPSHHIADFFIQDWQIPDINQVTTGEWPPRLIETMKLFIRHPLSLFRLPQTCNGILHECARPTLGN